jgi:hypothetical protein
LTAHYAIFGSAVHKFVTADQKEIITIGMPNGGAISRPRAQLRDECGVTSRRLLAF